MIKFFDSKIHKHVYEIGIGEVICTNDCGMILSTLLGSCISVCISDSVNKVYGMNHFMLPGNDLSVEDAKYGVHAINILVNQMIDNGAKKEHLQARVFGAGEVHKELGVAAHNAFFVHDYLRELSIPVVAGELGGNYLTLRIIALGVFFCCSHNREKNNFVEY